MKLKRLKATLVKANKKGKEKGEGEGGGDRWPGQICPPTVRGQIKRMQMHVVQQAASNAFPFNIPRDHALSPRCLSPAHPPPPPRRRDVT
jgi:hypothetical protein